MVILAGVIIVNAYNPGGTGNPSAFGHSANEIDGMLGFFIGVKISDLPPSSSFEPSKLGPDGIGYCSGWNTDPMSIIGRTEILCGEYCQYRGYASGTTLRLGCSSGSDAAICLCFQKGGVMEVVDFGVPV